MVGSMKMQGRPGRGPGEGREGGIMAESNGHDRVTVEMVEILREIRDQAKGTNERLETLAGEVKWVRGEISELRGEVGATNARLDRLHEDVLKIGADTTSIKNEPGAGPPTDGGYS